MVSRLKEIALAKQLGTSDVVDQFVFPFSEQIFFACFVCFAACVLTARVGSRQHGLNAIAAASSVGHAAMLCFLLLAVTRRALPPFAAPSWLQS